MTDPNARQIVIDVLCNYPEKDRLDRAMEATYVHNLEAFVVIFGPKIDTKKVEWFLKGAGLL